MNTGSMTPHAAAELLRLDYRERDRLAPITLAELEIGEVQARIVNTPSETLFTDAGPAMIRVLCIRGTDSASDWRAWNLLIRPQLQLGTGDVHTWARGFLSHAERVFAFAKGWLSAGGTIDWVTGHSLGGAAAQIIGPSLGIRTITFGAPRPLFDTRRPAREGLVENHVLTDDWVTRVPVFWGWPPWRFSHIGRVVEHKGNPLRRLSDRHAIERYGLAVGRMNDGKS